MFRIIFAFFRNICKACIDNIVLVYLKQYVNVKFGGVWQMYIKYPQFKSNRFLARYWYEYFKHLGSDIPREVTFKGIPCFPHHEMGIFISQHTIIGKGAVIFQHVTIGSNTLKESKVGSPIIGDNCYIGAGATIIGNVKIGDNCRIGANACVYKDMPDNSVAVCSPTRIIEKETKLDNTFVNINGKTFDFNTQKYVKLQ